MGENSAIAWTDHTFNPWMGCVKVSPGCEHCYAETLVTNRMRLNVWGPPKTTERKRTSESTWKQPLAWNRKAQREGKRARVFCASLADVFEDHPMVAPWRAELFALIEQTPYLDWQLLTKRPENLRRFLPQAWLDKPRPNVWLGTTVEDQRRAEERIPHLLATPAVVRFLSCEPLLEPVDLLTCASCGGDGFVVNLYDAGYGSICEYETRCEDCGGCGTRCLAKGIKKLIDWVIVGGESGPGARPFNVEWARSIRSQCAEAKVACFIKQLGSNPIMEPGPITWPTTHRAGADPAEWPADLQVQQFPEVSRG